MLPGICYLIRVSWNYQISLPPATLLSCGSLSWCGIIVLALSRTVSLSQWSQSCLLCTFLFAVDILLSSVWSLFFVIVFRHLSVPLSAVCCVQFGICFVCCLLSFVCCMLCAVRWLLPVACCLFSVVCLILSLVCCLLAAVCYLFFDICYLLYIVCCLLSAIWCLLSIVC